MTKMDLAGDGLSNLQDQEYTCQPNEFADKNGLCWPPAMVSAVAPEESAVCVDELWNKKKLF